MSIVPSTNIGKLTFYEAHIIGWTAIPAQLGLLSSDCSSLATLITAARKAYDTQQTMLESSKAATQTMKNAVAAMHTLGSADIAKIKAYAESTHNPGVFPLANLPEPGTPSPVGPPGTPTDFNASIDQSGAVKLTWKCANPVGIGGTIYEVRRRTGANTNPFNFIGFNGKREFVDAELTAGSTGVTYQVTATRSTMRGNPAVFNVAFGINGGGGMFIASTSEGNATMKMAA